MAKRTRAEAIAHALRGPTTFVGLWHDVPPMTTERDDGERGKRRARRRAVVGCAVLFLAGGLVLFVYANVRIPPAPIERATLDTAIQKGMDYLDGTDRFRRLLTDGGPWPMELWMLKPILVLAPHEGLSDDVQIGWQAVLNSQLRPLAYLPGEPEPDLSQKDRRFLRRFLKQRWSEIVWEGWGIYARYPDLVETDPDDFRRLLSESLGNSYGYVQTHRILVFRLFRALHSDFADRFDMPALERRAFARMVREMLFDFRVYDLYFERLVFLLDTGKAPPFIHRWIERVLADQREDGGWSLKPSFACELRRFVFMSCDRGESHHHSTFLAVSALVRYRELVHPAQED